MRAVLVQEAVREILMREEEAATTWACVSSGSANQELWAPESILYTYFSTVTKQLQLRVFRMNNTFAFHMTT